MTRWLRRLACGAAALALAYGLLLIALNASGGRWAVIWWLNHTPPVVPGSARCAHAIITPDLRVRAEGISVELQSGRRHYTLTIPSLRCERSLVGVWRRKHLTLTLADVRLAGRELDVRGLTVTFDGPWPRTHAEQVVGQVSLAHAQIGAWTVNRLTGPIVQYTDGYAVDPLQFWLYSGEMRGRLRVLLEPDASIELQMATSALPLSDLAALHAPTFGGADGTLHGALTIAGSAAGITTLQGLLMVDPPGGSIGSALLQALVPYLPHTAERRRLEIAVASGALVPFASGSATVALTTPQQVTGVFKMAIPEYNLLLNNLTVDVRLESPAVLVRALQLWRQLTE